MTRRAEIGRFLTDTRMLHFLGIGAQKAGTTWLYQQLRRHPEVGFPRGKEAHFWDRMVDANEVSDYLAAFSSKVLREGDITPAYAVLPVRVIGQIRACAPDLRLIYLLRNPIERAWSSALMALQRAEMRLEEASDAWFHDHFRSAGSLSRGDYAVCIRNWRSVFPSEQLLLMRYEAIREYPEVLLQDSCAHLGVQPPNDAMLSGCRQTVFAGPGHPLPKRLRVYLQDLYRPRIAALEDLLGEDFGSWIVDPFERDR